MIMSASQCFSLWGTMVYCIHMLSWAPWYLRMFQLGFLMQWRMHHLLPPHRWCRSMQWGDASRNAHSVSLVWSITLEYCYHRCQHYRMGHHLRSSQGTRQVLKVCAALLALTLLLPHIQGCPVSLHSPAAVSYIQKQGETYSMSLLREVETGMILAALLALQSVACPCNGS